MMGKGTGRAASRFTGNKGLIWGCWLLSTCGFGILLGGVASLQSGCNGGNLNGLAQGALGGYLAPVSCGHFFQYTWWITFLHWFAWLLVLVYLLTNILHRTRAALCGILAAAAVLLMDTAHTYLQYNYLPGLTGTMLTRARVVVAGAIIAAVADLLLILLCGYNDDTTQRAERGDYHNDRAGERVDMYTAGPVGTATTTTTTAVPTAHAAV